jgi:hypothetical protein
VALKCVQPSVLANTDHHQVLSGIVRYVLVDVVHLIIRTKEAHPLGLLVVAARDELLDGHTVHLRLDNGMRAEQDAVAILAGDHLLPGARVALQVEGRPLMALRCPVLGD